MRNAQVKGYRNTPALCLARPVDGRPALLYVDSSDGVAVALKPTAGRYSRPLWIPLGAIFVADPQLFGALKAAYERGDIEGLKSLWKNAKSWKEAA